MKWSDITNVRLFLKDFVEHIGIDEWLITSVEVKVLVLLTVDTD